MMINYDGNPRPYSLLFSYSLLVLSVSQRPSLPVPYLAMITKRNTGNDLVLDLHYLGTRRGGR